MASLILFYCGTSYNFVNLASHLQPSSVIFLTLFYFSNVQDLGLAQNTATNTRTPIPLGSLAHQIYRVMCSRGYANKDFSSVFQFLREEEAQ